MASLAQQIASLADQLEKLRDAIPVDEQTAGITLEQHSPGNGSTYTRLRTPKGKTLANGKRTMSLKVEDVAVWEQKIYARNQQAKVAQCLTLVQQAAKVAEAITWDFGDAVEMVKRGKIFTISQTKDVEQSIVTSKQAIAVTHVKTKRGSLTHAVAGIMPSAGPWHVSALCGARPPKRDHYGWEIPGISELTCGKCYKKFPDNYELHFPRLG